MMVTKDWNTALSLRWVIYGVAKHGHELWTDRKGPKQTGVARQSDPENRWPSFVHCFGLHRREARASLLAYVLNTGLMGYKKQYPTDKVIAIFHFVHHLEHLAGTGCVMPATLGLCLEASNYRLENGGCVWQDLGR